MMKMLRVSPLGGGDSVFQRAFALSALLVMVLSSGATSRAAIFGGAIDRGDRGAGFDGKKDKRDPVDDCDVKNFGKVNEHIYRGGQPKDEDYRELVALGIKTVIDLREDPENYARRSAEKAGLQYINIRLNSKRPPTEGESAQFLDAVNNQKNWPVFVHCAGGRHRTGVLIAVYRMEVDGWSAQRAYAEMKDFKFYSSHGHGDMKEYVFDYFNRMMAKRATEPATTTAGRLAPGFGQDK